MKENSVISLVFCSRVIKFAQFAMKMTLSFTIKRRISRYNIKDV